jgi:hypothetical protein
MKLSLPLSAFICVYLRRAPFALILAAAAASAAPPLPAMVNQEFPGFTQLGEGTLRFLTIHVYDSSVWIKGPKFVPTEPFALEIRYAINIKGKSLTERSLKEMRGLGYTDEAKLKPGDRIVGVHVPGKETRFYSADKFLGVVEDPEFARAFFGIWLDEKTSEPKLRAKMLALER